MNEIEIPSASGRVPWNKGKLLGQKPLLKFREVWTIRTRRHMTGNARELALFNVAIDSKLRGCDLVRLKVSDVMQGDRVLPRAALIQQKTRQVVRIELTEQTREAVSAWIMQAKLSADAYLFPSRQHDSPHLSTHQYGRIVKRWIALIGGDPQACGTHSLRRTKATLIYRKIRNLRAVQPFLDQAKIESTVRYLGIEVDDALEMAERVEC